jgi:hypothetical protein
VAHESVVYGYIESPTYTNEEYRKLQGLNLEIIASLPEEDEFPFIARSMFSAPQMRQSSGTFRSHIIHFGGSMNHLTFDEVPKWVVKFELLLRRLYWSDAAAHVVTDYIDGVYHFQWGACVDGFRAREALHPEPTQRWVRKDFHGPREWLRDHR